MTEFASIVADTWKIDARLASEICSRFEKGDSALLLVDYHPQISAELELSSLSAVFEFLRGLADLAPKKKRVMNALRKANQLTDALENRIKLCTNGFELDDIMLPFRPNPRSHAQIALRKGLGELSDILQSQEVEDTTVEELAERYVGKDSSLGAVGDVIAGVKDILVERFAYDETVRSMARAFGRDDAYIEVLPRNKKDRDFIAYRGKMVPLAEIAPEEYFRLLAAERTKQVRLKYGVQLFRITELLRNHFIVNPDSTSFDFICGTIDECWARQLSHVVDSDVKEALRRKAEDWAIARVVEELDKRVSSGGIQGTSLAVGLTPSGDAVIVAFGPEGHLLGATRESGASAEGAGSGRLKQFIARHRPRRIVVHENERGSDALRLVRKCIGNAGEIEVTNETGSAAAEKLAKSAWMDKECAYLDAGMRFVFAIGLSSLQPLAIMARVGIEYFTIHPLQEHVPVERLSELLRRTMTEGALRRGISFLEVADSALKNLPCVTTGMLEEIRKQGVKQHFGAKNDLLKVEKMSEVVFRNIAGYIYFPNGAQALDRTLVHPDHFEWVQEMASDLGVPIESLVNSPEQLRGIQCDDYAEKMFIERRLIEQLRFGQQFQMAAGAGRTRKRLGLSELTENSVVSGRVTNITQFGVFVDINAVCDGLVHISQLADGYVETAEQVVGVGDQVNVRIMKVDTKKRRISLSMKGLGDKGPRVRPTRYQLTTLADHFKNR